MIRFDEVSLGYEGNILLKNLSFNITKGTKATLRGRSGSGKSSIMKTILGFTQPMAGKVTIRDREIKPEDTKYTRSLTSWVPQDIWTPLTKVDDFLLYPFSFKANQAIRPSLEETEIMLEKLLLPASILKKSLKEISGGEKQRIALCSSLLLKKAIVLWDEPTSALDESTKRSICDFVMTQPDLTLLVTSHDNYWIEQSDLIINVEDYHVT